MEAQREQPTEYAPGGYWDENQPRTHLVFDIQLYQNLYAEALQRTGITYIAREVVRQASANDSQGTITERVSTDKDKYGQPLLDQQTALSLQLTPPRHEMVDIGGAISSP